MNAKESKIGTIFDIAKATRTPISCSIELTQNCNFRCPHCFIQGIGYKSLPYEKFVNFIDQFQSRGGLFITLTGGEVLMHPNFIEIYSYACKKGLAVTVFTNGYLVNENIVNIFKLLPPRKIEISIYGANNDTYEKISSKADAYSKVRNNIELLINNGLNVHLKTTLFQQNYGDFFAIKKYATDLKIPFRYDFKLMPKRNGEKSNMSCQLSSTKIIDLELEESPQKHELWRNNYPSDEKYRMKVSDSLFNCGAARYSCFLSSQNQLRICASATFSSKDMDSMSFDEAWKDFEKYTKLLANKSSKCIDCEKAKVCDICPIWGYMIHNDVEYLGRETELHCSLADERVRVIENA